MSISAEFFRTDFINQVIVDQDENIGYFYVYNLEGKSYSNSMQVEVNYELLQGLTTVVAFRLNDVQMTTAGTLQNEVFVNRYKGLLSFSYQTSPKKWQFDLTAQLNGKSRLPNTSANPEPYRRGSESPVYTILNAQITKYFKRWDIYLGGENLTNYMQKNPIIAADDPFGSYFDASQIWGPIYGVKIYAGIRYAIKR
jgi:outer membrane receptor for ferrienterochelin and colicins